MSLWAPFTLITVDFPGSFRFTQPSWTGAYESRGKRAYLTVYRGEHSDEIETLRLSDVRDRFVCLVRDDPENYCGKHWEFRRDPKRGEAWFTERPSGDVSPF